MPSGYKSRLGLGLTKCTRGIRETGAGCTYHQATTVNGGIKERLLLPYYIACVTI